MRVLAKPVLPLLLVLAAVASVQPGAAQRVDPNRVYDVTVQAVGQIMSATIREGGMFRLTLDVTDEYRLVPIMAGGGGGTVTMAVYRGTSGQPSTSRIVERVELTVGRPVTLRSNPDLSLVIDRIRSAPPQRQASVPRTLSFTASASWRRAVQDDQCCVCCGRACGCACGVKMSCGSCCMSGCCPLEQPTASPGGTDEESRRAALVASFLGVSACERPFSAAAAQTRMASR
ncbi:MAG TPA: hypothetical protein VGX50_19770 [Longimicrobium sp.]|jgi:hypothetical protein|nr:hypothetical protein [Longimicrobium sp.]